MKKIYEFFPSINSRFQAETKELVVIGTHDILENEKNKIEKSEKNTDNEVSTEMDIDQNEETKPKFIENGQDEISSIQVLTPNLTKDKNSQSINCGYERTFDRICYSKFDSKITVRCLSTVEDLQQKCTDLGLTFVDYEPPPKVYEVDMITAYRNVQGGREYKIKWKNYPSSTDTWEPDYHLTGCQQMIEYFHAILDPPKKINFKLINIFITDLITRKPTDTLVLERLCVLFGFTTEEIGELKLTNTQMKQKVKEVLSFHPSRIAKIRNKLVELMQFAESRKLTLIKLKEWENKINEHTCAFISVENNVDLELPPNGFTFIHDYINETVTIPEEPVAFCHCNDCYKNKDKCCPNDSEGHFAYSVHRRLLLKPGYPIYECNKRCQCASTCVNRVVQHGQRVKVCIFRTSNGCGWGLKTLETIEKDQFVLEYLGEIITTEEAEARGRIYDYIGRSYLFDLDYGVENCCYTVDAGHYGNAAHFINHSCNPNLHVFAVWINQPDPSLPRLAFFAKRKIMRGEELTFDYKMMQKDSTQDTFQDTYEERIQCNCNSKNCRKFLF